VIENVQSDVTGAGGLGDIKKICLPCVVFWVVVVGIVVFVWPKRKSE